MKYFVIRVRVFFAIYLLFIMANSLELQSQEAPVNFKNPIITGYHPDPSICRVGDDYYLVNSTFIWHPGIPIYHSKDLVNWELIGHGITREDQIDLDGLEDRQGIYAVTIRHHEGVFYLITTCVNCKGNFYVTASDPAGEWSDPVWLPDAPGIDPSLMWDDDGKCYYTGHMSIPDKAWPNQCGIWLQELDLEKQKLVGERKLLTYGHANNASFTEAPHLYKINGKYMLMISEGGTEMYHSLSVHHSDSLFGPYVADMINPVITHRHLGEDYPIYAIGHGDLVETQNGEWWCVLLGKRKVEGETTLARETFLSKVEFEGQTPIFNPGEGKVLKEQKRPDLAWSPLKEEASKDEFDGDDLGLKWYTIRTPKKSLHEVSKGHLNLKLAPEVMDSLVNPSLLIQRIKHHKFEVMSKMDFKTSKNNEQAGVVIYRTRENHYSLLKEKSSLVLYKSFKGQKTEVMKVPYNKQEIYFKVEGDNLDVQFSYGESITEMKPIGQKQSLIVIADGNGNQFNGAGIGVYATSNGDKSTNIASFDWFEYKSSEE